MSTVTTDRLMTAAEFSTVQDSQGFELVEGRVVYVTPPGKEHNLYENRVAFALTAFVRPRKLGEVYTGETGIYTRRDPDTVRAADVVFISNERLALDDAQESFFTVAPDLVVEVASPRDTWTDITDKLLEYFTAGVRLAWVVHPKHRAVYVYNSPTSARIVSIGETLDGGDVLPGFSLAVAEIFEE